MRQKYRRKPSVLYCPEACEEDMVYSSDENVTSEMEETKIHNSITKFAAEKKKRDTITVSSKRRYPHRSLQSDTVDFGGI